MNLDMSISTDNQLSPFWTLMVIGLFGVYGTFVPSPYDIGELLVYSIYNATACLTDWCQETKDSVLTYYELGMVIMMPGGFGGAWYVKKNERY